MGFPPAAWFEEVSGRPVEPADRTLGVAGRVEHLFETFANPKTGRPYTSAEVARVSLGGVTEGEAESIRTGAISDPTVGQVAALAGVFGVEPSYLLDRGESVFDVELVEALRHGTIREAALEISRLSERERRLVLGIVRQFGADETSSRQNQRGPD